jgi:hypothetical protein
MIAAIYARKSTERNEKTPRDGGAAAAGGSRATPSTGETRGSGAA